MADFASLSPDCLAGVLQHLTISDMHSFLLSSRVMYTACSDERVWHSLCQKWAPFTDLHRWVVPATATPLRNRACTPPSTYRELYYLLHRSAPIVGLWRLVGEGPVGALIAFSWTPDSIKGEELQLDSLDDDLDCVPYRALCPRRGRLSVRLEVVDDEHAVVKDLGASQRGLAIHRSPSAEAAASVALSQSSLPGGGEMALGTSPQGSFEYEWLQFMAANVSSGRAKQRRKAARSPGGPGASPSTAVHHLKRVQQPQPTHKHPLAGLWAEECADGSGIEMVRVVYDFSGSSARIVATKVTGNRDVPAGQQAWVALAAPLPRPWKQPDRELVDLFQARWAEEDDARGALQQWMLDEEQQAQQEQEEQHGGRGGGGGGLGGGRQPPQQQVVDIHEARMQVTAGAGAPAGGEWVPGRLWVLRGGGLAFLLVDEEELLGMRRMDADIASILS